MGTNKLSDVWSLGCLFYELLTGDCLFESKDLTRVTMNNEKLIPDIKLKALNNNIYLIDFLNYLLVRDPRHRPSLAQVLKRFEHVHAL